MTINNTLKPGDCVWLITPTAQVKNFTFQVDRDYFSQPVSVTYQGRRADDSLAEVHDPVRDHTYPARFENLHRDVPTRFKKKSRTPHRRTP